MAGKKLPKDIDLTKKINPADGFFANPASGKGNPSDMEDEKINAPAKTEAVLPDRNAGGRPPKKGLKSEQYTLTMRPELYEKIRIIAQEHTEGNFSALIEMSIKSYCNENNINLDKIKVAPAVLEAYQKKQDRRRSRKK